MRHRLPIEVDAVAEPPLGMPVTRFLAAYWQRRPLLIRQAFPGFRAPLSADELAGIACEQAALARMVWRERSAAGDDPTLSHWRLATGPFPEDTFATLPERDWTLLVQDVDKWDANVARLLDAFPFLPRWRIDDVMVSYARPGGSVGPHVDQYDVFLLQAGGRRRWQIDSRPNGDHTLRQGVELKLLERFTPDHDWVLEAGDMLYLPPGVPHHGEAIEPCMTFSIGMRAPAVSELLTDLAECIAETLGEEQRYADPDLQPGADPYEIDAAAMARVKVALGPFGALPDDTLRRWFGTFITRYRSAALPDSGARVSSPTHLLQRLEAGKRLFRHPFVRSAWTRCGRRALLFLAGEVHSTSTRAARRLAAANPIDAATFAAFDTATREALCRWVARGLFRVRKARRGE